MREHVYFGSLDEWMSAPGAHRKDIPVFVLPMTETQYRQQTGLAVSTSFVIVTQLVDNDYVYRLRVLVGNCTQPDVENKFPQLMSQLDKFRNYVEQVLTTAGFVVVKGCVAVDKKLKTIDCQLPPEFLTQASD